MLLLVIFGFFIAVPGFIRKLYQAKVESLQISLRKLLTHQVICVL